VTAAANAGFIAGKSHAFCPRARHGRGGLRRAPQAPAADQTASQPTTLAQGVTPALSALATAVGVSTATHIGVAHVFDSGITTAQIAASPNRYNVVWGSFNPGPWRAADPAALVSRYYILNQDSSAISGRSLTWWQQNNPSWILYACTPTGGASRQLAYTPGSGFHDVPLDIHNSAVRDYQIRSVANYAITHGYNAVALDEVILTDVLLGGNPTLGQSVIPGYFGCGIWQGNTFVRHYSSRTDPAWAADVLAWIARAHQLLPTYHLSLIINHPAGSLTSTETKILSNANVSLNETGYTDYGKYFAAKDASLFTSTVNWTRYAQQHGVRVVTVDKFYFCCLINNGTGISNNGIDYSLATYELGNEGASDLVITGPHYNIQPYYFQYTTNVGAASAEMYRDSPSPNIYIRRIANAIAVVNAGSTSAYQIDHLPSGHTYRDVLGRASGSLTSLRVNANDGYLMTTTNGCH